MHFSIVPALTLALFGGLITADCCKNGLDYCGYGLLNKGWALYFIVSCKSSDANRSSSTQQAITTERSRLLLRGWDYRWTLTMCGTRSSTAAAAPTRQSSSTVVLDGAPMEDPGIATIANRLLDATRRKVLDWPFKPSFNMEPTNSLCLALQCCVDVSIAVKKLRH